MNPHCILLLFSYPVFSPRPHPPAAFIQPKLPKLLPKGLRGITWSAAISGLVQPASASLRCSGEDNEAGIDPAG